MDNTADSAQKGWALIWDYLKDKPIIGSLFTAALFFRHPKQTTNDAIAEHWKNKLTPPRFLIKSFLICLGIWAVTPVKDLLSLLGDTRRHFLQFADVIAYACSVFGGAMALHFTLNRKHCSAIHAFFAFCYLQGSTILLINISVLLIFFIFGVTPTNSMAIASFVILPSVEIASCIYVVIVVDELYRPKWYSLILGLLAGLTGFVVIGFCLTMLATGIAARLPK